MRIAIIDDISADRAELRARLQAEFAERKLEAEFFEFETGEAFLAAFAPKKFAAVFLDIYMGRVTGMDVARHLFLHDPKCRIVFLTISREHMLEGYSVRATHYLMKPVSDEMLAEALDFCFPAPSPSDVLLIRTREGHIPLQRRDILYIESINRHGCIHLAEATLESTDSFSSVTAPLADDPRFLLCGRGQLVQMEHIQLQKGDEFIMEDGRRLSISRRIRSEVLETFRCFALKNMEEVSQ